MVWLDEVDRQEGGGEGGDVLRRPVLFSVFHGVPVSRCPRTAVFRFWPAQ